MCIISKQKLQMYVVTEIICQQIIIAMMQRHEEPWPNVVFTTSGVWKLSLSSCEMYAQLWCCIAQDRDFCEININPGPYQAKYQSSIICHLRFQKRCRCKKVQTYLSFITFIEFFNKRTYIYIKLFSRWLSSNDFFFHCSFEVWINIWN